MSQKPIQVDPELHRELKVLAAKEGIAIGKLVKSMYDTYKSNLS